MSKKYRKYMSLPFGWRIRLSRDKKYIAVALFVRGQEWLNPCEKQ